MFEGSASVSAWRFARYSVFVLCVKSMIVVIRASVQSAVLFSRLRLYVVLSALQWRTSCSGLWCRTSERLQPRCIECMVSE